MANSAVDPDDLARLAKYAPRFEQYSPGFQASTPDAAAASLLAAIERSSLEGGYSGSFLSHNGTKRWM